MRRPSSSSLPPRTPTWRLVKVSLASLLLLVVIWGLENLIGERAGFTALLTYIPQHGFGILPLLLLLIAAWKRDRAAAGVNLCALGFWLLGLMGFHAPILSPFAPRVAGKAKVRIVTFNIELARGGLHALCRNIQSHQGDIINLQESARSDAPAGTVRVGDRIAERFPGWTARSVGDVTTLSHYPLLSSRIWPQRGSRRILETVWQTPNGPLRILNVHASTSFKGENYVRQRGLKARLEEIIPNAGDAAQVRLAQIPQIEAATQGGQPGMPVIMTGDFNTVPRGLFYHSIASQWRDAFAERGFGIGTTFPSHMPLLRIDYVWLGPKIQVNAIHVADGRISDHRALIADLSF